MLKKTLTIKKTLISMAIGLAIGLSPLKNDSRLAKILIIITGGLLPLL